MLTMFPALLPRPLQQMRIAFDSSALMALVIPEAHGQWVRGLFDKADEAHILDLTLYEAAKHPRPMRCSG